MPERFHANAPRPRFLVALLAAWAYLAVAVILVALARGLHEAVDDVRPEKR